MLFNYKEQGVGHPIQSLVKLFGVRQASIREHIDNTTKLC